MLSAFEWMCYGNVRRTVHVGNKWCGRKSSLVTAANKTEQQPVINSPNNPGGGSNGSKCQAARQNTHSVLDSPADTHCQHSGFMAFWLLLLFLFKIDLKIKKEEVWATVSAEGKKRQIIWHRLRKWASCPTWKNHPRSLNQPQRVGHLSQV